VAWLRAALALVAAGALAASLFSGGSPADPRTPPALPGLPDPFFGTTLAGSGGLAAAIDAYGDVVDLRPAAAGPAWISNPSARQAAGTVAGDTGIQPRVSVEGGPALPIWRADSVAQRYRAGTNVVVTAARFGRARATIVWAAGEHVLACLTRSSGGARVSIRSDEPRAQRLLAPAQGAEDWDWAQVRCDTSQARADVRRTVRGDRRWLARARPLGPDAPAWARRMYRRSLLTLRALSDRRGGAIAAGARDGWAYVWPRDAGAAVLALAAAGYKAEGRRSARFLLHLDLEAAARFRGDGSPVSGRDAQGDATAWATVAARAAGLPAQMPRPGCHDLAGYDSRSSGRNRAGGRGHFDCRGRSAGRSRYDSRDRADYQEGSQGDYLANAIAAGGSLERFKSVRGLVRSAGDAGSGLDSAAAWAVEPFGRPGARPFARRTLLALYRARTRFGIVPGEAWEGVDPWTAPTAWTAWSLAALGERAAALGLLADLRRAATPAGDLPERVDSRTGVPRSTTPLAWSHAFAILTLQQLWPSFPGTASG
jgi:hypothetical protein